MNRWQKVALFNLLTTVMAFIACFILTARMSVVEAITPPSPLTVVIIIALVLIGVSEKLIFRKTMKQVDYDERDKQIHRSALIGGGIAFMASMFIMVMAVFYVKLLRHDFPTFILPLTLHGGGAVATRTARTVRLIKYR